MKAMKYKVGDKVRIKTWEEMEKEFGIFFCENISGDISINCFLGLTKYAEEEFAKSYPDRIVTIKKVMDHPKRNRYVTNIKKRFNIEFSDAMIKCLVYRFNEESRDISYRFKIMDI